MKEINKLFVPFEIALLLKEKGFDEGCLQYFIISPSTGEHSANMTRSANPSHWCMNWNDSESRVSVPLYQQVIDWFREKHNLNIQVYPSFKIPGWKRDDKWGISIEEICTMKSYGVTKSATPKEALDKGIKKAIKLI